MDSFGYKKIHNYEPSDIREQMNLTDVQYYSPIFQKFFVLNDTNAHSISLQYKHSVSQILEKKTMNIFEIETTSETNTKARRESYVKFSPLFDPIKYLCNKYKSSTNENNEPINPDSLQILPSFHKNDAFASYLDYNNPAYVDGMFNYLSSLLLHEFQFVHGIDCYGLFVGMHSELGINIIDDIELVQDHDEFKKNHHELYELGETNSKFVKYIKHSRGLKEKLKITTSKESEESLDIETILDADEIQVLSNDVSKIEEVTIHPDTKQEETSPERSSSSSSFQNSSISSDSSYSTRTSHTRTNETIPSSETESETETETETEPETDNESNEEKRKSKRTDDADDEEYLYVNIYNMPSQIIFLEKCEKTIDTLVEDEDFSDNEFISMLMQIILTLAAYQKVFKFTHNDLHCNNIVYNKTEREYLYYYFNKTYYKVPTYGRIYKIIDFGRSIYTYKNELCMGSCFQKNEVASNQYNYGPYLNEEKPIIEPNYSFDLCRFACSIFDIVVDPEDTYQNVKCPLKKIIMKWCLDDHGKSVLYKRNGVERYPEFKLYKMISRIVHRHTPENAIKDPLFKGFIVTHASLNKKAKILNIDKLPELWK